MTTPTDPTRPLPALTQEEIDELRTAPRWVRHCENVYALDADGDEEQVAAFYPSMGASEEDNAERAVLAHNALPALLDEREGLLRRVADLERRVITLEANRP